jgi:hypothetical protein
MESEGGSDPSEDVAKLFAVTESLVGAGIAPSIHQGRGIIISALSKSTVRATIETSDDEEDFSFEIVKEELWRAVRLLEEHGCGNEVPSAATFLDSKALRMKMAGMFLMTEMPLMGRASTSSGVVPSARVRASSSSPAAALSAPPHSGTCAISNDAAAREQLGVLVGLLEEGLSDSGVTQKGAKKMTPGCLFVRVVAGLVGNALAKSSSSSTMWGAPRTAVPRAMHKASVAAPRGCAAATRGPFGAGAGAHGAAVAAALGGSTGPPSA